MNDVTKLPKWAQSMISDLQSSQSLTGATISDVSVNNIGFQHNEESSKAIESVANALAENAKALGKLADNIMPKNITQNNDAAIKLENIRAK
jgi:uncharacterized Zn finger protein